MILSEQRDMNPKGVQVQTAVLLESAASVGELHSNVVPYLPHEEGHANIEHLVMQIRPNALPKDWAARSAEAGRPDAGRKCKKNNPIPKVSNI